MILAYHSIFSMYGFWLPNDPRGSGSDYVASWELFRYGPATKTDTRRSVAGRPVRPNWQREAKSALQYPPAVITGRQALAIGRGFATAIGEATYRVYACAILPDHVHLIIGASARGIRQVVGHLRSRATHTVREQQLWDDRPLWGEHGWNVYLESVEAVQARSATLLTIRLRKAKNCKTGRSSSRLCRMTRFVRPSKRPPHAPRNRRGASAAPR